MTKWYGVIAATAIVATLGGCLIAQKDVETASSVDPVARGEYLVTSIAGCGNCHTPKGPDGDLPGMNLAGGQPFPEEGFTAYASNITPDMTTGIGDWSADQIVDAIREGRRPDGSLIAPPMPIEFYRGISDNDAYAMAAYLMNIAPIKNEVPALEGSAPLPDSYGPPVANVPDVSPAQQIAYGAYLAGPIGHCLECHTPWDENHRLMLETDAGAGGREFHGPWGVSVSADIRAGDPEYGLGTWSDEEIYQAVTEGRRPDGSPMMPPMGYGYYDRMTDGDLMAVIAFLRTLTPDQAAPADAAK